MPDFSNNDINEAKRRVQEMRNRAKFYTEESNQTHNNQSQKEAEAPKNQNAKFEPNSNSNDEIGDILSNLFSNNDSAIILAMIMILSREKADNMLILALLYILL